MLDGHAVRHLHQKSIYEVEMGSFPVRREKFKCLL